MRDKMLDGKLHRLGNHFKVIHEDCGSHKVAYFCAENQMAIVCLDCGVVWGSDAGLIEEAKRRTKEEIPRG